MRRAYPSPRSGRLLPRSSTFPTTFPRCSCSEAATWVVQDRKIDVIHRHVESRQIQLGLGKIVGGPLGPRRDDDFSTAECADKRCGLGGVPAWLDRSPGFAG